MKRYVIADTHFGHKNVIDYSSRPFKDVIEMDNTIISNWNSIINKEDLVYILGDFTLSRRKSIIKDLADRLNGRKILIMGNHDTRKPRDYIECGFEVALRKPMMVENGVILMHEPFNDPSYISSNYIYFYGHVHTNYSIMDDYPNCCCVSIERIEYKPIELDEAIKMIREKANCANENVKAQQE